MYPVIIGNGRSLQSDAIIGGYQVPKGVSNLQFIAAQSMQICIINKFILENNLFQYFNSLMKL
jgi:hypothetical protein